MTGAGDLLAAAQRLRWLLAGGLAAAAVAVALPSLAPAAAPTRDVLTAARDLPGGTALSPADVAVVALPVDRVPEGALSSAADVAGRAPAGPVRRGEPLTDVRLAGPALLDAVAGDADLVAVPVRLADPGAAALVRPGDRVDVLAAATSVDAAGSGSATVLASSAPVLAVPAGDGNEDGVLVVLATPPTTAARLAAGAVTSRLSVALRR